MANKILERIYLDKAKIMKSLNAAGYSIRAAGRALGYDDRTIRKYLDDGCMPGVLYYKLMLLITGGRKMNSIKEVLFQFWCPNCEHCDEPETDEPCNNCLAQGWNVDSTKPLYFKDNGKEKKNGNDDGVSPVD